MNLTISPALTTDLIRLTGRDRAKSLNNLCTQEIVKAQVGNILEAFITSPQGKTIGFCRVFVLPEELLLVTNQGGFEDVIPHFQKYTIFDDMQFEVLSGQFESVNINHCKPAESLLDDCFGGSIQAESEQAYCTSGSLKNLNPVYIANHGNNNFHAIEFIGPIGISNVIETELKSRSDDGLQRLTPDAWNLKRILAGWPLFGSDIKTDQLPQEVDRDKTAISFHKGCYLGQETVARLDALGHVNRMLMQVTITGISRELADKAQLPLQIVNETGQNVGELRSIGFDAQNETGYGLVMIRLKALDASPVIPALPNAIISFNRISTLNDEKM